MRANRWVVGLLGCLLLAGLLGGCGGGEQAVKDEPAAAAAPPAPPPVDWAAKAAEWLSAYQTDLAKLEQAQTAAYWKAANSGKKEDFDAFAAADLALRSMHSDKARYEALREIRAVAPEIGPAAERALAVAELAFQANQLPPETLKTMVEGAAEIEQIFNTFRADLGGKKLTNNELLEKLKKEKNSAKRKATWEALKAVGAAVAPKLTELAKVRNAAAAQLGFANYWDMQVRLQEHDPDQLLVIFDELEKLTDEPFRQMKGKMDAELAKRFKVKPKDMMPWHYDNPFFQDAPPSAAVNLDDFFKKMKKEDIPALAHKFYADIGLPADDLIEHADLYEREGKDQHAFCISMDRADDVRMLLNIKPTADWMDTMLHETGHGVYYKFTDRTLPYNLREAAHIFTTEAIAMMFGAQAKNPTWLVDYAGADAKKVAKLKPAILEQRRREQLIFARWALVMLNFEKALYENPDADLNTLWWDTVERFQLLKRPAGRNAPDWASKPHFTIAPVYYHNYMLGELFAAQLRAKLAEVAGFTGSTSELSFKGQAAFGPFLSDYVFKPGMIQPWPAFVQAVTGKPLKPEAFAAEVK